jgi:hypothetical protein
MPQRAAPAAARSRERLGCCMSLEALGRCQDTPGIDKHAAGNELKKHAHAHAHAGMSACSCCCVPPQAGGGRVPALPPSQRPLLCASSCCAGYCAESACRAAEHASRNKAGDLKYSGAPEHAWLLHPAHHPSCPAHGLPWLMVLTWRLSGCAKYLYRSATAFQGCTPSTKQRVGGHHLVVQLTEDMLLYGSLISRHSHQML